jgi:hypothetical protein
MAKWVQLKGYARSLCWGLQLMQSGTQSHSHHVPLIVTLACVTQPGCSWSRMNTPSNAHTTSHTPTKNPPWTTKPNPP